MARIYKKAYMGTKVVPLANAQLSIASSAVLYGLSVYTVFPLIVSKRGVAAFRLPEHFERLLNSSKIMGIDTFERKWSYKTFEAAVRQVVKANKPKTDCLVRATVHVAELVPGTRSRGLQTTLSMFMYETKPIVPQEGARLKTSVWRRVPDNAIPSRAKVNGAYVNSVLAKQDALDSGYDDSIFLDANGHVCELSAANIFMVRNGVLITPDTGKDLLEGITRRTVLEIARDLGITIEERAIDLSELYIADEVFACGTSCFIASVGEIDARKIGSGKTGSMTKQIRDAYHTLLHSETGEYLTLI